MTGNKMSPTQLTLLTALNILNFQPFITLATSDGQSAA